MRRRHLKSREQIAETKLVAPRPEIRTAHREVLAEFACLRLCDPADMHQHRPTARTAPDTKLYSLRPFQDRLLLFGGPSGFDSRLTLIHSGGPCNVGASTTADNQSVNPLLQGQSRVFRSGTLDTPSASRLSEWRNQGRTQQHRVKMAQFRSVVFPMMEKHACRRRRADA